MWLSVHLFYDNLDQLLIQVVFPFIHKIKKEKGFDQYFFIRYSEGGKHIRLRMKTERVDFFKKEIETYVLDFFLKNPSTKISEQPDFYPNNYIQYISYEPEIDRYGGKKKLPIAEQQFQLSSEIIQNIIEQTTHYDYEMALGIAIQLHLIFIKSVGLTKTEAASFANSFFKKWQSIVPKSFLPTREQILERRPILEFIQNFWEELENTTDFGDETLQRWFDENRDLVSSNDFAPFYDSYVHMTNNRLGILNVDELLVMKLIEVGLR